MKVFIVAGSVVEAERWMAQNMGNRRAVEPLVHPDALRGLRESMVVIVAGNYEQNPEWLELKSMILAVGGLLVQPVFREAKMGARHGRHL